MFELTKISKIRLAECDERLQSIVNKLSLEMSICVCCGHRGQVEQNLAYTQKRSKLMFPKSKHNKKPSLAVDIAPLKDGKIDWNDIDLFNKMLDRLLEIAKGLSIEIRLGRDFSFKDYPHIELK